MIKKLFYILVFCFVYSASFGGVVHTAGGVAPSGGACTPSGTPFEEFTGFGSGSSAGNVAGRYYAGYIVNAAQSSHDLCSFKLRINTITGDISAKTYVMEVWTTNSDDLVSKKGTSTAIDGSTISTGFVTFQFPSAPTVNTSDAIVITNNGFDGSNYIGLGYDSTPDSYVSYGRWESDGTNDNKNSTLCLYYQAFAPQ